MKSRISTKGQITVPAEIRETLGLFPGTAVEFLVREGEVIMRKNTQGGDPVDRVYGSLRIDRPVDVLLEEMRGRAEIERPAKRRSNRKPTTRRAKGR